VKDPNENIGVHFTTGQIIEYHKGITRYRCDVLSKNLKYAFLSIPERKESVELDYRLES
jgi:hypothetical protein